MRDVEQWREEFEVLAKAKGLNLERKPHAFVDVEYYVSKQTLWLWSGYIAGRRAGIVTNIAKLPPEQPPIIGVQPDKPWPRGELPEPPSMRIGQQGDTIDRAGVRRKADGTLRNFTIRWCGLWAFIGVLVLTVVSCVIDQ